MIRIVIAEDQAMLRGALASLLSLEDDLDVVGTAEDGDEGMQLVSELKPDVLLTDIEMPKRSGIDIAASIHEQGLATRVLVVTTFARPGYLQRAMQAGVSGYVLKDASSDELAGAIRTVHSGQRYVPGELASLAWTTPDPLSTRERQVLRLAEAGMINKQIAAQLDLSVGTVRNYLADAMQKLAVNNRVEAFRKARDLGWL
ncbi:MAG: response regulator transcription factor [Pseudomonadota bacterium]